MPSRRQRWIAPVLLAVAALFAIHPLMVHGCSCGHDFDFHLLSWLDAARQFQHGELHPHWAFSPAWNAGEPRFVFYPPLSWYIGALLGLLLTHLPGISETAGWNATPIVFTWLALTLSGWTMYRLARHVAPRYAALLAATVYLANPYMLFTAYERTAYAELLAAAWLPMLFGAVLRPRPSIPRIAIPLALLWLTNAPAAVIGSYSLALLALLRILWEMRHRADRPKTPAAPTSAHSIPGLLAAFSGGTVLGLLIAAFYIVPAAWEQRFVEISLAMAEGLRIDDNTLFHHTVGADAVLHDQILHTASVVAIELLLCAAVATAAAVFVSRRPPDGSAPDAGLHLTQARLIPTLIVLTAAAAFLLTRLSLPLWHHAPEAAFLQFPWRALSVVGITLSLALAIALSRVPLRSPRAVAGLVLVIAAFLCVPAYRAFRQGCDPEDTPSGRLVAFASPNGTEPTDEYTPVTADNDVLTQHDPGFWLAAKPDAPPPGNAPPGPAPNHLSLQLPRPEDLILNRRAYPAWEVILDGEPDLQRLSRPDGLLVIPLPGGSSTIDIRYVRLPDQKIGDILTLLGLGLLGGILLPARWRMLRARPQLSHRSSN